MSAVVAESGDARIDGLCNDFDEKTEQLARGMAALCSSLAEISANRGLGENFVYWREELEEEKRAGTRLQGARCEE